MTTSKYDPGTVEARLVEAAGGILKPTKEQQGYFARATYNEASGTTNLVYVSPTEMPADVRIPGKTWGAWQPPVSYLPKPVGAGSISILLTGTAAPIRVQLALYARSLDHLACYDIDMIVQANSLSKDSKPPLYGASGVSPFSAISYSVVTSGVRNLVVSFTASQALTEFNAQIRECLL